MCLNFNYSNLNNTIYIVKYVVFARFSLNGQEHRVGV